MLRRKRQTTTTLDALMTHTSDALTASRVTTWHPAALSPPQPSTDALTATWGDTWLTADDARAWR